MTTCGWCRAAPGARVKHRSGVAVSGCLCSCHNEKED